MSARIYHWLIAVVCAALAVVLSITVTESTAALDQLNVDLSGLGNRHVEPDPRVALVLIEPSSLDHFGGGEILPRRVYGQLIQGLDRAGARVVLLDLFMHQKADDPAEDQALVASCRAAKTIKVVVPLEASDKPVELETLGTPIDLTPHPVLQGVPHVVFGTGDTVPWSNRLMAVPAFQRLGDGSWLPHVSTAAVAVWNGQDPTQYRVSADGESLQIGALNYRTFPPANRFIATTGAQIRYPHRTIEAAIADLDRGRYEAYKDKIVVVGFNMADRDHDKYNSDGENIAGVQYVADCVNSLLLPPSQVPQQAPLFLNAGVGLALALLALFAITQGQSSRLVWQGILLLLTPFVLQLAVRPFGVGLSVVPILLATVIAFVLGLGLIQLPGLPFRGATHQAVVLFVDIRQSTPLVMELGPERSRELLSRFLQVAGRAVEDGGGRVERFLGDGLLAIFEANRLKQALDVACKLPEKVAAMDEIASYKVAAGLELGPVSYTKLRSRRRQEWSSFGPTVHLAQRLQAAAPENETVLIGPNAAETLRKEGVETAPYQTMTLKGIEVPVNVYRPLN